jgi:hypothetical protein
VQRFQLGRTGTAHRLAIDGHVFDLQSLFQGLHPSPETGLERRGVQAVEDTFKGVVGGNPVGQIEEACQPGAAFPSKERDGLPILGTGKNGTQGNDDDVLQRMQPAVCTPRILELAKIIRDRQVARGFGGGGKSGSHDCPP